MRKLLGYIWCVASQRARKGVEDAFMCGTAGPRGGLWPHTALLFDNCLRDKAVSEQLLAVLNK